MPPLISLLPNDSVSHFKSGTTLFMNISHFFLSCQGLKVVCTWELSHFYASNNLVRVAIFELGNPLRFGTGEEKVRGGEGPQGDIMP